MTPTNQIVDPSESPAASVRNAGITHEMARSVLTTIDAGLVRVTGDVRAIGKPLPGEMGVAAAVCHALGQPEGSDPGCVMPWLRQLTYELNEHQWSCPKARAKGLRRLILAQLGSKDALDDMEFARRVIRLMLTKQVPAALRAAASVNRDPKHQAALNAAAEQCESGPSWRAAYDAYQAVLVTAAAGGVAGVAAHCAANAALSAATGGCVEYEEEKFSRRATPRAAGLVAECIEKAALAASHAAWNTSGADAYDKVSAEFVEDVVRILVEMQAPGCQWLDLTEQEDGRSR